MKHLTKKCRISLAILSVLILLTGWIVWSNNTITVLRLRVNNHKVPQEFDGFRIAVVSDLHNHDWGDKLIRPLTQEAPDIIVITGDLVDSSHTDIDIAMQCVDRCVTIAPVYYVTGNHEAWLSDFPVLRERLIAVGVHMMDDTSEWIEKGDSKIQVIGIQDPDFVERDTWDGIQKAIVSQKLAPMIQADFFNLVLCHRPELFDCYVESQADLAIAGHAHGGQVRLPLIGGLVAPNQGLFPKYTEGMYHRENTDMVVSRGLGNSILPIRFNNSPELVFITLHSLPR